MSTPGAPLATPLDMDKMNVWMDGGWTHEWAYKDV